MMKDNIITNKKSMHGLDSYYQNYEVLHRGAEKENMNHENNPLNIQEVDKKKKPVFAEDLTSITQSKSPEKIINSQPFSTETPIIHYQNILGNTTNTIGILSETPTQNKVEVNRKGLITDKKISKLEAQLSVLTSHFNCEMTAWKSKIDFLSYNQTNIIKGNI